MKPYFRIVGVPGVDYMHDPDDSGIDLPCDYLISCDTFPEFEVQITDARGNNKDFRFENSGIGEIFSRCAGVKDIASFVTKLCEEGDQLYNLIQNEEVYDEREGMDETAMTKIVDGQFPPTEFFFSIHVVDNMCVLSLVFHNLEVKSKPVNWPEFTPQLPVEV